MSDLVAQLLAATPVPPATDDVDELIAAAFDMLDARETVLATAPAIVDDEDRADPRLDELARRGQTWATLLAAHRDRIGAIRAATSKARAYRQGSRR